MEQHRSHHGDEQVRQGSQEHLPATEDEEVKPSQKIFQQRDIAQSRMAEHARRTARYLRVGNQKLRDHHLAEFTKWEIAYQTLSELGSIASGEEQRERKAKEKKHKEYEEAHQRDLARAAETIKKEVDEAVELVEKSAKELARNNFVSDIWQDKLNQFLSMATTSNSNYITLNTSLPTTATTSSFTIPRFKVGPLPQPGPAQGSQMVEEEEVEGIV
jgi:hypothetical protein